MKEGLSLILKWIMPCPPSAYIYICSFIRASDASNVQKY
jgi:hypothetical protein